MTDPCTRKGNIELSYPRKSYFSLHIKFYTSEKDQLQKLNSHTSLTHPKNRQRDILENPNTSPTPHRTTFHTRLYRSPNRSLSNPPLYTRNLAMKTKPAKNSLSVHCTKIFSLSLSPKKKDRQRVLEQTAHAGREITATTCAAVVAGVGKMRERERERQITLAPMVCAHWRLPQRRKAAFFREGIGCVFSW